MRERRDIIKGMFYEVIPTKVFRNGSGALTYLSEEELEPGKIVMIPLGRAKVVGIVTKKVKQPEFECKKIISVLYDKPLPRHLIKSIEWLAKYYLSPLPMVSSLVLPVGVEKKRRKINLDKIGELIEQLQTPEEIELNPAQRETLEKLKEIQSPSKLLFGVTGSGKTNIYLKLTEEALEREESTILLVPEIALTSQLVQVFETTFKKHICLIHSKQTEAERHQVWERLLRAERPQVVVGPRSALFAPLEKLGLIIIDEAHEATYYQENSPKYSALRLASFMSATLKIPCLFGTATPLVTDFYIAKEKDSLAELTQKAKDSAIEPEIQIIDFKDRQKFMKSRYFSDKLIDTIRENLGNNLQTLIYHNRRGSAPITMCESCGWQAMCPNCYLPLTLHSDSYSLICHSCGHKQKIPSSCPECKHPSILHKGFGTKLLETELNKLFDKAKIIRFDADSKKGETLDALYTEVKRGDYQIIIGTQTVSRGLDLPKLASIGIIQADAGLSLPDYSAEEKTFELLTQVIGRVGRGHQEKASVIIQTFKPDAPAINFAVKADYPGFYDYMIQKRKQQQFPPFCYLGKLSVTYKTEETTLKKIQTLQRSLNNFIKQKGYERSFKISSAMPCFHERTNSGFSWQIVIKARSRAKLLEVLETVDPKLGAHITIDPMSLL